MNNTNSLEEKFYKFIHNNACYPSKTHEKWTLPSSIRYLADAILRSVGAILIAPLFLVKGLLCFNQQSLKSALSALATPYFQATLSKKKIDDPKVDPFDDLRSKMADQLAKFKAASYQEIFNQTADPAPTLALEIIKESLSNSDGNELLSKTSLETLIDLQNKIISLSAFKSDDEQDPKLEDQLKAWKDHLNTLQANKLRKILLSPDLLQSDIEVHNAMLTNLNLLTENRAT